MSHAGNNSADRRDAVAERLAAAGVQLTAQRIEIARVLLEGPCHLSADELAGILQDRDIRVSKATVYNTLNLLSAKGLAKTVVVDPNRVFYDSTTTPHHHFYNMDTGRLTDIPATQVKVTDLPPLPEGTEGQGIDVVVRVRNRSQAT